MWNQSSFILTLPSLSFSFCHYHVDIRISRQLHSEILSFSEAYFSYSYFHKPYTYFVPTILHWKRPWCWEGLGQEEKGTTEDEMAGWYHQLDGHEFEWTPEVGDGQGGLSCCDSWGRKESDTTEQLNWTELILCWGQESCSKMYLILMEYFNHSKN